MIFKFADNETNEKTIFNEICKLIYHMQNILVVIEEAHFVCNPHFIPHWFKKLITAGRSKNIAMYYTSVRPGLLNGLCIDQSSVFILGNVANRNDIKALDTHVPGLDENKIWEFEPRKFLLTDGFKSSIIHT